MRARLAFGIQLIGLLISVGRPGNTLIVQAVRAAPQDIVVVEADVSHVALLAARTFGEKVWLWAEDPAGRSALLGALRAQGETSFALITDARWGEEGAAPFLAEGCRVRDVTSLDRTRPPLLLFGMDCARSGP